MSDHEVAEKIVVEHSKTHGAPVATTELIEAFASALKSAKQELARAMIAEGDRFIDAVKGRQDERADGAFVAMTRLVRNLKAVAKANGVEVD